MTGSTCATCKFAAPKTGYEQHQCRRNAPDLRTVSPHIDTREHVPIWPIVSSNDWCGEYRAAIAVKENSK